MIPTITKDVVVSKTFFVAPDGEEIENEDEFYEYFAEKYIRDEKNLENAYKNIPNGLTDENVTDCLIIIIKTFGKYFTCKSATEYYYSIKTIEQFKAFIFKVKEHLLKQDRYETYEMVASRVSNLLYLSVYKFRLGSEILVDEYSYYLLELYLRSDIETARIYESLFDTIVNFQEFYDNLNLDDIFFGRLLAGEFKDIKSGVYCGFRFDPNKLASKLKYLWLRLDRINISLRIITVSSDTKDIIFDNSIFTKMLKMNCILFEEIIGFLLIPEINCKLNVDGETGYYFNELCDIRKNILEDISPDYVSNNKFSNLLELRYNGYIIDFDREEISIMYDLVKKFNFKLKDIKTPDDIKKISRNIINHIRSSTVQFKETIDITKYLVYIYADYETYNTTIKIKKSNDIELNKKLAKFFLEYNRIIYFPHNEITIEHNGEETVYYNTSSFNATLANDMIDFRFNHVVKK